MDEEIKKLSITDKTKADSSTTPDSNPWNKLDDVMVETVLARLPTIEILRCQFVCKRWKSIICNSPTFSITSKKLFNRRPWFFMFNSSSSRSSSNSVVYDMEVFDWRHVRLRVSTTATITSTGRQKKVKTLPIASSGGLICFKKSTRTYYNSFIVNNPITGASRCLPKLKTNYRQIKGVAMHALKSESVGGSKLNYKIFIIFGKWPKLVLKVFSSEDPEAKWKKLPIREVTLVPKAYNQFDWASGEQLGGVTTLGNEGQILVHYLNRDKVNCARLICFDTLKGTFFMSTSFGYNYGKTDLVECSGKVFGIALTDDSIEDYVRCKSLGVFEFNHEKGNWKQLTVLRLNWWKRIDDADISQKVLEDYGSMEKTMNCSGHGDYIMICFNYYNLVALGHLNHVFMYNIKENTWTELPPCLDPEDDGRIWFGSPYRFEPEIQAEV